MSTILEKIEQTNDLSHQKGCCCRFVPLSDKIGIKMYRDEFVRNVCFERQKSAAELQCGPKAKFPSEFDCWDIHWYAFLTEIADIENMPSFQEMDDVCEKLLELNFDPSDLGSKGNIGYIQRKYKRIPVVVDFSHFREDHIGDLFTYWDVWNSDIREDCKTIE